MTKYILKWNTVTVGVCLLGLIAAYSFYGAITTMLPADIVRSLGPVKIVEPVHANSGYITYNINLLKLREATGKSARALDCNDEVYDLPMRYLTLPANEKSKDISAALPKIKKTSTTCVLRITLTYNYYFPLMTTGRHVQYMLKSAPFTIRHD